MSLLPRWMGRGVVGIVLATFFSDVGHEMVTAVLPLYLTSIGLGPAALGIMEGLADFAFSLSKLAGGFAGHHSTKRRALATAGYGVTAFATAAIAFVSSALAVGGLRFVAWLGRGFRSPLRDALLAEEVEPSHFGRAYGIERSADMLGAVAGPLLALALLALHAPLSLVIGASIVPSLLSAFFIATIPEGAPLEADAVAAKAKSARLPRAFWLYVGAVFLFGLGDFSRTFLIYLAAHAFSPTATATSPGAGLATGSFSAGVLAYTLHNVISGFAAAPAGRLGDHWAKRHVLLIGYGLGVVTNGLLALGGAEPAVVACAVLLSGIYIAIEETVEKATAAELLPRELRSLGFGVLACGNAIGDLVSSLYVGALLDAGRGPLAFGIAAGFGALGAVGLALWRPPVSR